MSAPRPGETGATRTCPHCKTTILESAAVCPACRGHLRLDATAPDPARDLRCDGDLYDYCSDDPVYAKKLEEAGAVAIMPLGAPIGSGPGIQNRVNLRIIVENAKVPVLVDAGVGTASDAAIGMELGCDAILMNTAIAEAKDPIRMAKAMKHAVIAGREAYLAGRMQKRLYADPSSPLAGLI